MALNDQTITIMIGALIGIIGSSIAGGFTIWGHKIKAKNNQEIDHKKRVADKLEKIDNIILTIQEEILDIENKIATQITPQNLEDFFAENLPEIFYDRNSEKLSTLETLSRLYIPDLEELIKDYCEHIRCLPIMMNAIIILNLDGIKNQYTYLDQKTKKAKDDYISESRNINQKAIVIKNAVKEEANALGISKNNMST